MSDPVLNASDCVCVRNWTKRDHFDNRTTNIPPRAANKHRKPRKYRCCCCCGYLPPRWKYERSVKGGRRGLLDWDLMENLDFDSAFNSAMSYDDEDFYPGRGYDDDDDDSDSDDGDDDADTAPRPDGTSGAPGTNGAHGAGGPGSGNDSGPSGGATKPPGGSGRATRNNQNTPQVTNAPSTTTDALKHAESEYDFVSEVESEVVDMWNRHEWTGLDGWVVVGL